MDATPPNPSFPADSAFASARVLAIGRAGTEMALALQEAAGGAFSYAAIDADAAAIASAPFPDRLFVGARLTRGFGAGGDPDLARAAADEDGPALRALCRGHELVFLLAGLGGGSGTGIAPVVARVAREAGGAWERPGVAAFPWERLMEWVADRDVESGVGQRGVGQLRVGREHPG